MAASRFQVFGRFWRKFHRLLTTGQPLRQYQSSFQRALTEEEEHAKRTLSNWKKISIFIAGPACVFMTYKALFADHEEHPDPDSYVPYSHLKIRNKPFPWGDGDHSLFHNKHANLGFVEGEAEEEGEPIAKEESFITKFMVEYLMDDPETNRKQRNEHMTLIRKRADEYMERKRKKILPPEPIDLDEILRETVRPKEFGVDGY